MSHHWSPRRRLVPALALLAGLAPFGACRAQAQEPQLPKSAAEAAALEAADALPRTGLYDAPSLTHSKPGALLRKESFSGYALPAGAKAVRILYHSLSAEGNPVATSGVVLVPAGPAPAGGWPVIVWAHGTSGVAERCAPSLEKDLYYGEEGLLPMVRAGFAVIATDYHGLGTHGPHQYVSKLAQARDVIYSVPAAHAAVPHLAHQWTVVGHSQGGLAAWGVAELEVARQDPDYLGAISVAGAAEPRQLLEGMATSGSAASFYLVYMAFAIHARWPDFSPDRMLTGRALERYADVTSQGCWYYAYASFASDTGGEVLRAGWAEAPPVRAFFDSNQLGNLPIRGPLLVIAGEADRSVPLPLLRTTVARACRNGLQLRFRIYPGLDHDPTMAESTPEQLEWIRDRIAGKAFSGNCAALPH